MKLWVPAAAVAVGVTFVMGGMATLHRAPKAGTREHAPKPGAVSARILETGWGTIPEAAVAATNGTDSRHNIRVTIDAQSPDGGTRYYRTNVTAEDVAPGQTAVVSAVFLAEVPETAVAVVVSAETDDY